METMEATFGFDKALTGIKAGERWTRRGWNGKGLFVFLVPGSQFKVNRAPLLGIFPEDTLISYHPHIDMRTHDTAHRTPVGGTVPPMVGGSV